MARKFFYVSAGIFLLALAYHLGARSAGAQGGAIDVAWVGQAGASGPYYAVAVQGRTPHVADQGVVPGTMGNDRLLPPIPGADAVVAFGVTARGDVPFIAMLANGDVYEFNASQESWTPAGNVFAGAPTNAKPETWGSVKARYYR